MKKHWLTAITNHKGTVVDGQPTSAWCCGVCAMEDKQSKNGKCIYFSVSEHFALLHWVWNSVPDVVTDLLTVPCHLVQHTGTCDLSCVVWRYWCIMLNPVSYTGFCVQSLLFIFFLLLFVDSAFVIIVVSVIVVLYNCSILHLFPLCKPEKWFDCMKGNSTILIFEHKGHKFEDFSAAHSNPFQNHQNPRNQSQPLMSMGGRPMKADGCVAACGWNADTNVFSFELSGQSKTSQH